MYFDEARDLTETECALVNTTSCNIETVIREREVKVTECGVELEEKCGAVVDTRVEDNNNAVQNIKIPLPPLSPVSPVTPDNPANSSGVLMRRKSSGRSSYGHRASQRFSRLPEGVTSLVTMSSMTATRTEEGQQEEEEEETEGPASLPYWVEASQNIYKVSAVQWSAGNNF